MISSVFFPDRNPLSFISYLKTINTVLLGHTYFKFKKYDENSSWF